MSCARVCECRHYRPRGGERWAGDEAGDGLRREAHGSSLGRKKGGDATFGLSVPRLHRRAGWGWWL